MSYARLIKYIPYVFMLVVIGSWYYTYTNAINENDRLTENNRILKFNEKQIIEAYESAAVLIEEKAYQEGLNKGSSLVGKEVKKNIDKLLEEREFHEVNNDVYNTTSF